MTTDEAAEFVRMVDGAWKPELTDVEKGIWLSLVEPLDALHAFKVLSKLMKAERFRIARPDFMAVYKRALIDATPVHPAQPEAQQELPAWVGGWQLARAANDFRLWPEQERGYDVKEWREASAQQGIMPQAVRLAYMQAYRNGERAPLIEAGAAAGPAGQ